MTVDVWVKPIFSCGKLNRGMIRSKIVEKFEKYSNLLRDGPQETSGKVGPKFWIIFWMYSAVPVRNFPPGERVTVSDKDATTIDLKGRTHTDVLEAPFTRLQVKSDTSGMICLLRSTESMGILDDFRWF